MTKKRDISFRCGQAEENGFSLWIFTPKHKIIDKCFFKTPGYNVNYKEKFSVSDWIFTNIVLIFYLYILNAIISPSNIYVMILWWGIIGFSIIYTPSLFYVLRKRDLKEWHACEQQTANLLDSDEELNIKNLKKASRIRKGCGTKQAVQYCFAFIYCVGVYYACCGLIWIIPVNNESQKSFIAALMLVIFWRLYYTLMASIFSPLTQHFITTAEPSEEKLEQALKVAQEIEETIN